MLSLADIHTIADTCPYRFPVEDIIAQSDDTDNQSLEQQVGLIALGGDLTVSTLLQAYLTGLFPWFNHNEPIAWWCPNPRCVMHPNTFCPAKSLKRVAKKHTDWHLSLNNVFDEVIRACSLPRVQQGQWVDETWIHNEIKASYGDLHAIGVAFSLEVWSGLPTRSPLVGGLYGLKIGNMVFGESMFHHKTDASKLAFWALNRLCVHSNIVLIDCQLPNDYLMGLGADLMQRTDFLAILKKATDPTLAQAKPITASQQTIDWQQSGWQAPLSWLYSA